MVSNDDIQISAGRFGVLKTSRQSVISTTATHNFTVPTGKRWLVKYVRGYRMESEYSRIWLVRPGGSYAILDVIINGNVVSFQSSLEMVLEAGWYIHLFYDVGVSGLIESSIIYEEQSI